MKHLLKKTLSVFLALIMLFALTSAAFAEGEAVTPVIVISGMVSYPIYNTETGESVFPMSNEVLMTNIAKLIPPLAGSVAANKWEIFAKEGTGPIHAIFEQTRCDENGESVYPVAPVTFPESAGNYPDYFADGSTNEAGVIRNLADKIGWDNVYFYYYDWRMDPIGLADDLDTMVNKVKSETGSDKVSFFAMSFGGMIASSYMYKYGTDNLKNVVYGSTAFNGVSIVGELFSGNIEIVLESVLDYLESYAQDVPFASAVVGACANALPKYWPEGVNAINAYLANIINVLEYPAYSEVFMDTYAHFKGIWCLMPNEYYESARAYMDSTASFSDTFFDIIDEYQANVQGNIENIFDAAQAKGVNIYIIGAYGYAGIPLTTKSCNHTDTLIDTCYMTGDAVVAPYGKTLDDVEYSTDGGCTEHSHISEDNIIYAGNCMLPEQTWIIKNMTHVEFAYGQQSGALAVWLTTADERVDVNTDARYPQFVELDRETGEFISLTQGVTVPDTENTADNSIIVILSKLLKSFVKIAFEIVEKIGKIK